MKLDYNFFKVEGAYALPQKGKVLISEPFLNDSYFKRSIVLLTEHSEEGAVGFVLNKPVSLKLNEVLADFPQFNASLSIGGPVSTNTIHYLHTVGDMIPNSVHVLGNVYWGGDFEILKEMVKLGAIESEQIRFFLGYSGWMANQLEGELERNSWVVTEILPMQIMEVNSSDTWKQMLFDLGEKYSLWPNFPENPQYN